MANYRNKAEQAKNYKDSAIVLIVAGVIGLICITLIFLDKFIVKFSPMQKAITGSIMGIMFLCMLIMGILSLRTFKLLKKGVSEEDNLTEEVKNWYRENLRKEMIDSLIGDTSNDSEEVKFFKRNEIIAHAIKSKFLNLDDSFIYDIAEVAYQEIFENED